MCIKLEFLEIFLQCSHNIFCEILVKWLPKDDDDKILEHNADITGVFHHATYVDR